MYLGAIPCAGTISENSEKVNEVFGKITWQGGEKEMVHATGETSEIRRSAEGVPVTESNEIVSQMMCKSYESSCCLLENLAHGIVQILVDAAMTVLQHPVNIGTSLDFAACLLKDAQRYDSLDAHAHARPLDKTMSDAIKKLQNSKNE